MRIIEHFFLNCTLEIGNDIFSFLFPKTSPQIFQVAENGIVKGGIDS